MSALGQILNQQLTAGCGRVPPERLNRRFPQQDVGKLYSRPPLMPGE
jgi:hypothetical protein